MSAELIGALDLKETLKDLPELLRDGIQPQIKAAAEGIKASARARVPTDEHDLQNDVEEEIASDGMSATVGSRNVRYASYTEWGTNDTPAQPFLFPAFQEQVRLLRKELRTTVNELGAKMKSRVKRTPKTRPKKP